MEDPNAALADILDLANRVLDDEAEFYPDNLGQDAVALAEAVQNLNTWLAGGGFIPAAWNNAPHRFTEDAVYAGGTAQPVPQQPSTPDLVQFGHLADALDKVAAQGPVCGGSLGGGIVREQRNVHTGVRYMQVQCRGCNEWFETLTGHVPPHPESAAWPNGKDEYGNPL